MKTVRINNIMKLKIETKKEIIDTNVENFFEKVVTVFGTGAKIDCPKEYIGKKVYVIVRK